MKKFLQLLLSLVVGCSLCFAIRIAGSLERIYDPNEPEIRCETTNKNLLNNVRWTRNEEEMVGVNNNPLIVSALPANYSQMYEGRYRCMHNNETSAPLDLYVLPEPKGDETIELSATIGEDATIECPLRFGSLHDQYEVRWTVDGEPITNGSDYLISSDPTERLIVKNVTTDHRGLFQCVASLHGLNPVSSPLVELMPYQTPNILSIGPTNPVIVANGNTIQVFCKVSGVPRPDIEWCINEECSSDWLSNGRYVVDEEKSALQISPAREEDDGFITCRIAPNKTINMTTELFVLYQIEVEVFRKQDDTVIVKVTLRREITFDYKIDVFVNKRFHKTFDGIQGKRNCNYTLSSGIRGTITARLSVGEEEGIITESVEIPPPSNSEPSEKDSGQILIAVVTCIAVVAVALIICITVIVLYKKKNTKQCNTEQQDTDGTEQQQEQQPQTRNFSLIPHHENCPRVDVTLPTPHGNRTLEDWNQKRDRRPSNASGASSQESVGYGSYCSSRCPLHCSQMACHCTHPMHSQHSFHGSCCDHSHPPHHTEGCHAVRSTSCCDHSEGCHTFQGTSYTGPPSCNHSDGCHMPQNAAPSDHLSAGQQPPARKTAVFLIRRNSSDPNISRHTQQSSRLLDQTTTNRTISSSSAI